MSSRKKVIMMRVGQRLFLKGVPYLGSQDTLLFGKDMNGRKVNDIEAYWDKDLQVVHIVAEDSNKKKLEIVVPVTNIAYMSLEESLISGKKVESVKVAPKKEPVNVKPTSKKGTTRIS